MKHIHAIPDTAGETTASYRLPTSHGALAFEERGRGKTTLLFIHGNSSCRKIFRHQMSGPLGAKHRLIALDLPGHGDSDDAIKPARTYTRPGMADAVLEVLDLLRLDDVIVVGWSLGGHIAIEMMARCKGMRGLMVCGAPPIGRDEAALGFRRSEHGALGRQRELTGSEAADFARAMTQEPVEPFLRNAIARADGRAREILFKARDAGAGIDQREAVESSRVPIAIVNGEDDPFVNLDYVDRIAYANLWDSRCHRLPGLGHAAFWNGPQVFNPLLERFVSDVTGR